MRQLTINELAPYLPYGVKFQSNMDKPFDEYGLQPEWTLRGIDVLFGDYCLTTLEINDAYAISSCRLLLRPLSDLTKPDMKGKLRAIKYRTDANGIEGIISDIKNNVAEYEIMLLCFENHIDVFNLIPDGLAIDINSLKS